MLSKFVLTSSTAVIFVWLFFAIFLVVFGIVFSILGYKRGMKRALLSAGLTLAAGVVSVFAAKLISAPFKSIIGVLVKPSTEKLLKKLIAADREVISSMADSIDTAIAALLIFIPLFIIFASIVKLSVQSGITRAENNNKAPKRVKSVGNKILAIVISVIDAALVLVILLFPVHTAAYFTFDIIDAVGTVDTHHSDETETFLESAVSMRDNPLISSARVFPLKYAGDYLMTFKYDKETVYFADSLDEFADIVREYADFRHSNNGNKNVTGTKLVDGMNKFSSENALARDISVELLKVTLGKKGGEPVKAYLNSINKANFDKNAAVLSDLMKRLLTENATELVASPEKLGDYTASNTFISEIVKKINETDELAAQKGAILCRISDALAEVPGGGDCAGLRSCAEGIKGKRLSGAEIASEIETVRNVASNLAFLVDGREHSQGAFDNITAVIGNEYKAISLLNE